MPKAAAGQMRAQPQGSRTHMERLVDLALEAVSARKSREFGRISSRALFAARTEGIALVIYERQQTVYHVTVARELEGG